MGYFIFRRLLLLLPTLLVPLLLVFFLLRLSPGDPAAVMLGADATPEQITVLRADLGLDKPLLVQLYTWAGQMASFDLGESIFLRKPVIEAIIERIEPTVMLTVYGLIIAVVVGMTAGIVSAIRRNSLVDQSTMALAMVGVSVPEFWLGLMLILVFSVTLSWFPVAGYIPLSQGFASTLWSLTLPAFAVGLVQAAFIARITRSSMLDVINEDFVRTARAKGMPNRIVILHHALPNAMVPVLTVIGISFAVLMGGAIAVEVVFNIPGIGRLMINAVSRRDYPIIQGIVLFMALTFIMVNLAVDILYGLIDPRIKAN